MLLLCHEGDPYARPFQVASEAKGIRVWRPRTLDDIVWSVDPLGDSDVTVAEGSAQEVWQSSQLSGVWFQGYPPLTSATHLDSRTRSYVSAEFAASLACVREQLRCPNVGLPPIDQTLVGAGLFTRVEMRRLGIEVLRDALVPSSGTPHAAPAAERTWVYRWGGESAWASELSLEGSTVGWRKLGDDTVG